jgi:hypothetical protein
MIAIPVVRSYSLEGVGVGIRHVSVVHDDELIGGTKEAALAAILPLLDGDEFVYAGPRQGYAQIALAAACRTLGKSSTLFVAGSIVRHARTLLAVSLGAKLVEVRPGYLSVVQSRARVYCRETGAVLLPFGLDCEGVLCAIRDRALATGLSPKEVWSVAGSGTLQRGLQRAWPDAVFYAVQVGKPPRAGKATVIVAPERYEQGAKIRPPFPSCDNYDAKVWSFIMESASDGAVFWNVAA